MTPVAPKGLDAVTFTHTNQAIEKAIKTAMAERGEGRWSVMGFDGSFKRSASFALQ